MFLDIQRIRAGTSPGPTRPWAPSRPANRTGGLESREEVLRETNREMRTLWGIASGGRRVDAREMTDATRVRRVELRALDETAASI